MRSKNLKAIQIFTDLMIISHLVCCLKQVVYLKAEQCNQVILFNAKPQGLVSKLSLLESACNHYGSDSTVSHRLQPLASTSNQLESLPINCSHSKSIAIASNQLQSLPIICNCLKSVEITSNHLQSLQINRKHFHSLKIASSPLQSLQINSNHFDLVAITSNQLKSKQSQPIPSI